MSNEDDRFTVQRDGSDACTVYQSVHFSLWSIVEQLRLIAIEKITDADWLEIQPDFGLNKINKETVIKVLNLEEINHAFYDTAFLKMFLHYNHKKKYDLILANKVNFFIYDEIAFLVRKNQNVFNQQNEPAEFTVESNR